MNSPHVNYDKVLSRPKAEYTAEETATIKDALRKEGERLGMKKPNPVFRAKADCKSCKGEGVVRDRVPYAGGGTIMTTDCDCAIEALTDQEYESHKESIDAGNYETAPALEWEEKMRKIVQAENSAYDQNNT